MLLHESLTRHLQKKPRLHFGESFTLIKLINTFFQISLWSRGSGIWTEAPEMFCGRRDFTCFTMMTCHSWVNCSWINADFTGDLNLCWSKQQIFSATCFSVRNMKSPMCWNWTSHLLNTPEWLWVSQNLHLWNRLTWFCCRCTEDALGPTCCSVLVPLVRSGAGCRSWLWDFSWVFVLFQTDVSLLLVGRRLVKVDEQQRSWQNIKPDRIYCSQGNSSPADDLIWSVCSSVYGGEGPDQTPDRRPRASLICLWTEPGRCWAHGQQTDGDGRAGDVHS